MDTSHRHRAERLAGLLPGTGERWQRRAGGDPRPFMLVLVLQLPVFGVSRDLCFLPSDSKSRVAFPDVEDNQEVLP